MSLRTAMRSMFIALLAVLTALPFLAAPADAAPKNEKLRATVSTTPTDVVVKVANGSMSIEDGFLYFRDQAGTVMDRSPLNYIAPDNRTYPIDASIKGNTATLVPSKNAARSTKTDASLLAKTNVADRNGYKSKKERDDAALARLNQEMAAGGTISALIGTGVGVVIGAIFGCLLGSPFFGIGCVPAAIAGATIGGILGTVAIGGPAALVSIQRYFQTVTSPFKNVTKN